MKPIKRAPKKQGYRCDNAIVARTLAGLIFAAGIIALVLAVIAGQPALYLTAVGFCLYGVLLFVRVKMRCRATDPSDKIDDNE